MMGNSLFPEPEDETKLQGLLTCEFLLPFLRSGMSPLRAEPGPEVKEAAGRWGEEQWLTLHWVSEELK